MTMETSFCVSFHISPPNPHHSLRRRDPPPQPSLSVYDLYALPILFGREIRVRGWAAQSTGGCISQLLPCSSLSVPPSLPLSLTSLSLILSVHNAHVPVHSANSHTRTNPPPNTNVDGRNTGFINRQLMCITVNETSCVQELFKSWGNLNQMKF